MQIPEIIKSLADIDVPMDSKRPRKTQTNLLRAFNKLQADVTKIHDKASLQINSGLFYGKSTAITLKFIGFPATEASFYLRGDGDLKNLDQFLQSQQGNQTDVVTEGDVICVFGMSRTTSKILPQLFALITVSQFEALAKADALDRKKIEDRAALAPVIEEGEVCLHKKRLYRYSNGELLAISFEATDFLVIKNSWASGKPVGKFPVGSLVPLGVILKMVNYRWELTYQQYADLGAGVQMALSAGLIKD